MRKLEDKLLWQKIYLNSAYGVSSKEFQDIYEYIFQTKERLNYKKKSYQTKKNIQ